MTGGKEIDSPLSQYNGVDTSDSSYYCHRIYNEDGI